MGRPIEGIFEVFVDEDILVQMMARASETKGRKSTWGAVTVQYRSASKAEAEFIINGQAFGKTLPEFKRSRALEAV